MPYIHPNSPYAPDFDHKRKKHIDEVITEVQEQSLSMEEEFSADDFRYLAEAVLWELWEEPYIKQEKK